MLRKNVLEKSLVDHLGPSGLLLLALELPLPLVVQTVHVLMLKSKVWFLPGINIFFTIIPKGNVIKKFSTAYLTTLHSNKANLIG